MVQYSENERRVKLLCDPAALPVVMDVGELDAEFRLTDRVVAWDRLRIGRGRPWEMAGPWLEDDEVAPPG